MSAITMQIDARAGFARVAAAFERMPAATDRAMTRALRNLATWMRRKGLQAASQSTGLAQKWFQTQFPGNQAPRFNYKIDKANGRPIGLRMWMGTYRIAAARFGGVKWSPYLGAGSRPKKHPKRPGRGAGARAGGKLYPGSFAWYPGGSRGAPPKSKRAQVLRRTGEKGTRTNQWTGAQNIVDETEIVYEPIHNAILARYRQIEGEAAVRFEKLLAQELNYALNHESAR